MVRPKKVNIKNTRVSARINGDGTAAMEYIMRTLGVSKSEAISVALNAIRDNFTDDMLLLYYETIRED